jgi:hypothetical protein
LPERNWPGLILIGSSSEDLKEAAKEQEAFVRAAEKGYNLLIFRKKFPLGLREKQRKFLILLEPTYSDCRNQASARGRPITHLFPSGF